MKPTISVVMAYYNRKSLLLRTLKSISASKQVSNVEVIVVDDGSAEEHRLEDIVNNYNFKIKLIRTEPEDKWYTNPCVPFNKGFKEAQGDIVVIQNPECYHLGDILDFATAIKNNQYYTYHAYSLSEISTKLIDNMDAQEINSQGYSLKASHIPFPLYSVGAWVEGTEGYYNHSEFRPLGFHFCSAINRKNLEELGGFDERYATGIAFDDNEFVERIKRMGLQLCFITYPMVLHQNHYKGGNFMNPNNGKLINKNHNLFNNITMNETTWKANQHAQTNS